MLARLLGDVEAITYRAYGGPEVLSLAQVPSPEPGKGEVRINVHAAGVNPYDFHFMRGSPRFMRLMTGVGTPKSSCLGRDVAGVVDALGEGVTDLALGDHVYGGADGAFAEQAIGKVTELVLKPKKLVWQQAAAIPMAALTGMQGLDAARVAPGSRVLINGASGGIGHFTVQIAKAMGAHVTAVCKTSNVAWVGKLGADEVVDYTKQSMLDLPGKFDAIIDPVANHSVRDCGKLLAAGGTYVWLGSAKMGSIMGPMGRILRIAVAGNRFQAIDAKRTRQDMERLNQFIEAGELKAVVEHVFPLAKTGVAIAHVEAGHTKGKTVIKVRN